MTQINSVKATRWLDLVKLSQPIFFFFYSVQYALHYAVWSTFQDTTIDFSNDINGFDESVVDLICESTNADVPKTTDNLFHNQKPLITKTISNAITCTAAYNSGLMSGNMDNYKTEAYNVSRALKEAKRDNGKTVVQSREGNHRTMWKVDAPFTPITLSEHDVERVVNTKKATGPDGINGPDLTN